LTVEVRALALEVRRCLWRTGCSQPLLERQCRTSGI